MIRIWTIAVAALFVMTAAATATTLPDTSNFANAGQTVNCTVSGSPSWCPWGGVGTDGDIVCRSSDGTNIAFFSAGELACWLYTGETPSSSGEFWVITNQPQKSTSPFNYAHANCVVSGMQTEGVYLFTYAQADWPQGSNLSQGDSDPGTYSNYYLSFRWISPSNLAAYSVYGFHIICPPKLSTEIGG